MILKLMNVMLLSDKLCYSNLYQLMIVFDTGYDNPLSLLTVFKLEMSTRIENYFLVFLSIDCSSLLLPLVLSSLHHVPKVFPQSLQGNLSQIYIH